LPVKHIRSEKRAQSFALIGAAFGLGFLLGPAVGGALGQIEKFNILPFHIALPF
jgi:DHA1 family tetracycline resistance protein-like MFS transporter